MTDDKTIVQKIIESVATGKPNQEAVLFADSAPELYRHLEALAGCFHPQDDGTITFDMSRAFQDGIVQDAQLFMGHVTTQFVNLMFAEDG